MPGPSSLTVTVTVRAVAGAGDLHLAAVRAVLDRVVDEVDDGTLDALGIGDGDGVLRDVDGDLDLARLRPTADRLGDVLRDGHEGHLLARDVLTPARLELGEREQLLDEAADAMRLAVHDLEELLRGLGGRSSRGGSVSA